METLQEIKQKQKTYFLSGATLPIAARRENLKRLKKMLKDNEEIIAEAVYKDFRKSYFEVRVSELGLVYEEITRAIHRLGRWTRPEKPIPSIVNIPGQSRVYKQPYGNVLIISPWNYPVQLVMTPVVNALAAGNTAIVKPSEIPVNTSALLAKLISDYFPPELLFVKEGGIEASRELLSMKFDKIFFTGRSEVGRIVMKAAAEYLTPVTLELGGKNPVILLPDCDIKVTAKRIVWGKFHNGGQACVAPDHVYVHEEIEDKFIQEVRMNIEKMFKGDAANSEAFPRIINDAHYNRILDMIQPEKVIMGGNGKGETRFIEPTVKNRVTREDPIMKEEIFGPVLPLIRYNDIDQLLDQLKEDPSPLALYVFTRNVKRAKKIQKEFRSGSGMINDTIVQFVNTSTPFGGFGESGMGSYHGKAGFDCFTHRKTVLKKPHWFELWIKYPPYTKAKLRIVRFLLK